MFVNRVRLFDVRLLHCELPGEGLGLPEAARRRLLLQGGNGSGKTTALEAIRTLWEFFGEWIDKGAGKRPPAAQSRHYLASSGFAAIELVGLLRRDRPLWIGIAGSRDWMDFKSDHPNAVFAGIIRYGKRDDPGPWRIDVPEGLDWRSFRQASLVGREPQPNMVHFPPDHRTVAGPPKDGPRLVDTIPLNWSAVYNPRLDLDSILLTVKALRPESYERSLELVNLALSHGNKRITGFGEDGRLVVQGTADHGAAYSHHVEDLSSGERQMLLLIAYTVAFLRDGGVVLIDEPDLHIHISMVAQLMETLELVVRERHGQLIVASHSQLVWDWFSLDAERIEMSPWRGGR